MLKLLLPGMLLALLAACSAPAEGPAQTERIADEAACTALGGEWTRLGLAPDPQCVLQTSDAGRACSDGAQCEGLCLAPEGSVDGTRVEGTCSTTTNPFGCQQRVHEGVVMELCVD